MSTNQNILVKLKEAGFRVNDKWLVKGVSLQVKKGKIVISDRYADSSFVYQGYVNKFGIKRAQKLHKELLNNFFPDYTFIFKINSKEIIKRLKHRKVKNKYDKSNLLFHQKVIRGYKKISNPKNKFV